LYSAVAGKKLWNSEYGEGDASGMQLAGNLNLDFRWLHQTAWCYWQPLDSGGWGLIQSNPGSNWIGTANPKYYVMAQYSRHIRQGMTIIDGGEGNTIAAYDATNHKLIMVTINYGTAQWINYDLSKFTTVSGPITRWNTNTGSGEKYVSHNDTSLSGKKFWSWFTANTVQTFEVQNVYK
jgi:galactan endo-1,6-beta-galactosidase